MEAAASAGIAYYAQWKVSDDEFGLSFTSPGGLNGHVVAAGAKHPIVVND